MKLLLQLPLDFRFEAERGRRRRRPIVREKKVAQILSDLLRFAQTKNTFLVGKSGKKRGKAGKGGKVWEVDQ
jgi:hypothetical protein